MAGEIQISYEVGLTVYFLTRNSNAEIWSSSGYFETYTTANYAYYVTQMTEQGVASAYYEGTFPAAISPGIYNILGKKQAGGSPLETDQSIGSQNFEWGGDEQVYLGQLAYSGQIAQFLPTKLTKGWMVPNFYFKLVSAADHITPLLSGIVSGQIARDASSYVALQSGDVTEVGLGAYRVTLTSGDLNADTAMLTFNAVGVSGGAADQRDFSLVMQKRT